jgi:ABC-type uncharacterized transport system ATPase subunit
MLGRPASQEHASADATAGSSSAGTAGHRGTLRSTDDRSDRSRGDWPREKAYGAVRVLDGVDPRVARGSAFVLLGPNGAGETTTVKILSTPVAANRGSARVAGYDVATDRDRPATGAARSRARQGA